MHSQIRFLSRRSTLAVAATLIALASTTAMAAGPVSTSDASAVDQRVERQADLVLWKKSGAAELQTASTYDMGAQQRYDAAYQRYLKWRSGPEYVAEVAKLRQTTSAAVKP